MSHLLDQLVPQSFLKERISWQNAGPCCVQTIQHFRKYANLKIGPSLPSGEQRGSKHGTLFQIPPLQRQRVYSIQS